MVWVNGVQTVSKPLVLPLVPTKVQNDPEAKKLADVLQGVIEDRRQDRERIKALELALKNLQVRPEIQIDVIGLHIDSGSSADPAHPGWGIVPTALPLPRTTKTTTGWWVDAEEKGQARGPARVFAVVFVPTAIHDSTAFLNISPKVNPSEYFQCLDDRSALTGAGRGTASW